MVHGHPIVFVSAKMNEGIDTMLDSVIFTYDKWNTRISTGMLNDWLQKFKKLDNLPKDDEMTLRINYVIQALVRPPHFIFFVNNRKLFKDNYLRFVTDNLAKEFKMDGIPFKITFRSTSRK
jgi:GTP-binding protein